MIMECPICHNSHDTNVNCVCPVCYPKIYRDAKGESKKMTTFKDEAKAYEPKRTLNVSDLDRFDISTNLEDREGVGVDGKPFKYKVAVINGVEYRVANTVLEETKKLLAVKDEIQFIKVNKNGSGLNTKYTVSVLN